MTPVHLIVSEGMRGEIGGLTAGVRNAEKAIDQIRTAEGAVNEVNGILIRMRELATQASNGTLNDTNREVLDSEFNQLKKYIDRIAKLASYNDQSPSPASVTKLTRIFPRWSPTAPARESVASCSQTLTWAPTPSPINRATAPSPSVTAPSPKRSIWALAWRTDRRLRVRTVVSNFDRLGVKVILAGNDVQGADGVYDAGDLDGKTLIVEAGTGGTFQLGSDGKAADRLEYDIDDLSVASPLPNIGNISVDTESGSRAALGRIDTVIDRISGVRGTLGAIQNRLEHTLNFTEGAIESVVASESTIRDADFAFESSQLARTQLLRDLTMAGMIQSTIPVDIVMSLLG